MNLNDAKIAVVGLGYVGLPLALEFAKHFPTIGYDISQTRVNELNAANDLTRETTAEEIKQVLKTNPATEGKGLALTVDVEFIRDSNIYIVTVPTPIDRSKKPDLGPLISATTMLGTVLKKGNLVIYESTTYPGCTEEECVPVLEKVSGLKFNEDFFVGYSPERINPGDKVNTLVKIKKVTSGSTPQVAEFVDSLYRTIIEAGTFKASSIKVAEASKAIENAQRDVNISFVNELAIIFEKLGIDTSEVLEAAGTKWNFLKYKPGLVGGHCIGVDPYYLAYKAEQAGYLPNVILSGRRVNDQMGSFIANKVVKMMIAKGTRIKDSKILILGVSFKENCPDVRNTKVVDIHREMEEFGSKVSIYDPWANPEEVAKEYEIHTVQKFEELNNTEFDAIILAVTHDEFKNLDFSALKNESTVIYDCKGVLDKNFIDARL
ncbi:nucleotide sugar dehydrogenase [Kaistella haifensis]|nr:nucleotide sugar dehydrogenase [Kaistella haifensis]